MSSQENKASAVDLKAMDETARNILNRIQSGFPLTNRPFKTIGDELGLAEEEVLRVVSALKAADAVRRIGGNMVPRKLGFVSTLCAASVPSDQIDTFAAVVNRYPEVTHNYIRDHHYNIWFTFIAPSRQAIQDGLQAIVTETGVTEILNLPATQVFKIKAEFKV